MTVRSFCIATVGVAVAVMALTGCGGSDSTDAAATSTSVATESATAPPTTPDVPGLPAPDRQVLADSLARFVDPTVAAPDKAALVVAGEKYIPQIETMNAGLANYGRITFVVNSVTVAGTTAVAAVDVTTPYTPTIPMNNMSWDNVDGGWKISETTVCNLLAFGQAACRPPVPAPPN